MTPGLDSEPLPLDRILGTKLEPGLVDIRGRIIRDGRVEAELEGRVERGTVGDSRPVSIFVPAGTSLRDLDLTSEVGGIIPYTGASPQYVGAGPVADVYWFESFMERHERERPTLPWH